MDKLNIKDFKLGWIIGDFDKSLIRTKDFEVGYKEHKKDEDWPKHTHLIATEYNVVIKGSCLIDDVEMNDGDIFIIYPKEIVKPVFLEDTIIMTVKIPSVPGDKYVSE